MSDKKTYTKDNDYTLRVVTADRDTGSNNESRYESIRRMTRIFNFAAQQLTTIEQNETRQYSNYGKSHNSAAMSSNMHIQNFNDIPSTMEIELMHAQLVKLGGKPPALDSITGKLSKPQIHPRG